MSAMTHMVPPHSGHRLISSRCCSGSGMSRPSRSSLRTTRWISVIMPVWAPLARVWPARWMRSVSMARVITARHRAATARI